MSRGFSKGDGTLLLLIFGGVGIVYFADGPNKTALNAAGFICIIVAIIKMAMTRRTLASETEVFRPLLWNGVEVPVVVVFQFSRKIDPEELTEYLRAPVSAAITRLFSASNDVPSHESITKAIEASIAPDVKELGIAPFRFHVTHINIPPYEAPKPAKKPKREDDPGIKIGD